MVSPGVPFHFAIAGEAIGKRFDVFLSEKLEESDISRSYIKTLIESGKILINTTKRKAGYRLREGDSIDGIIPVPEKLEFAAEAIPLNIIFEDESLIIINKQAGISVHPSAHEKRGTLVNSLLHYTDQLSGINGVLRPGIVHRLDKTTSGILLVAKSDRAHVRLSRQFQHHLIQKEYLAFVQGNMKPAYGKISYAIGRSRSDRKKMAAVQSGGRDAETRYTVEESYNGYDCVRLFPLHGRTHQIRVHLSQYGHPVLGDELYGKGFSRDMLAGPLHDALQALTGNALHAFRITFIHPIDDRELSFEAPLPEDLLNLQNTLKTHFPRA